MVPSRRDMMKGAAVVVAVGSFGVACAPSRAGQTIINVRSFGAVGDGVADDTAAVQAACNAAGPGERVVLPEGVFSCRTVVLAKAGVTITGPGTLSHRSPQDHLLDVRARDVTIMEMRLEGAASSARHRSFAVFTSPDHPAPRLSIEAVTVSSARSDRGFNNGFKLDTGADASRIIRCRIEKLQGAESGFGYGLLCGPVTRCLIEDNSGIGTVGRGRHFIYLSGGASFNRVQKNHVTGFERDGITIYSTDAQPPCRGNEVLANTLIGCANGVTNAAVSLAQNVTQTLVSANLIQSSGGCGILADGTGSKLLRNNRIVGNKVLDSQFIGIDLKAFVGGSLTDNEVQESSRAAAGTYSNIRLISDGATATSDVLVEGNISGGANFARSAFQTNATKPIPTGIVLRANDMRRCRVARYEFFGGTPRLEN